ncbi:MAG: phage tail tube protein [Acholeplasmataceae bacterium]
MDMADYVLGKDAVLYQGPAAAALGSLTEMSNVRDVTLSMEGEEADVTTRAAGDWRATAVAFKTMTLEWEMLWKPDDAGFEAIKDAFLNGTEIELAALTGARETANSEGPKGTFVITGFSRNEPLGEGVTVSVTAKPSLFDEWVKVADDTDKIGPFTLTLTAGAATLDLTAIPYGAGTYDASTKTMTRIKVANKGANELVISEGASNGYKLFGGGGDLTVPAGVTVDYPLADAQEVGASYLALDLAGTSTQTSTWTLWFED